MSYLVGTHRYKILRYLYNGWKTVTPQTPQGPLPLQPCPSRPQDSVTKGLARRRRSVPSQSDYAQSDCHHYTLVMNVKLRLLEAKGTFQMEQGGWTPLAERAQIPKTADLHSQPVLPQSTEKRASSHLSQKSYKTENMSQQREGL